MNAKNIIPIVLILLLFSCRKNNRDEASPLADKIKKTIIISPGNNSENKYFYDNAGRLSKLTTSDGSISEYTYEPGKVLIKTTNANGVFYSIGELNSRGLRVTLNSTDGSSFWSYSINNSGYVEKEVLIRFTNGQPSYTQTRVYFYNASTSLMDSTTVNLNNSMATTIYTAYTNFPDDFLKNTGNFYTAPALKFLPLQTKGRSSNDPPNFFRTTTYSYEFDSKNRLTKRTSVGQNSISTTQYVYYD